MMTPVGPGDESLRLQALERLPHEDPAAPQLLASATWLRGSPAMKSNGPEVTQAFSMGITRCG
jgi:hypothetical protein